ncbi:MAG: dethiobiotin synthase [Nitrospirota bacterium]
MAESLGHAPAFPCVFVTGTDTGVGKTFVTSALARHLKHRGLAVGVMKPIETGVAHDAPGLSDADRLARAAGVLDALDLITPYRFPDPLAPLAAARRAGLSVDVGVIARAVQVLRARHTVLLVEGVGGVLVPIGPQLDVRDLIARLGTPVLVVGRASLGGVNHALLTVEAVRQRGLTVLAIALNEPAPTPATPAVELQVESTVELIRELTGAPVFGPLRHVPSGGQSCEATLDTIAQDNSISSLADLVLKGAR